jgi:hypothetical protein
LIPKSSAPQIIVVRLTACDEGTAGGVNVEGFIVILMIGGAIFAGLGAWIASQKNRDQGEGMLLGCQFGPFGALVEALLPTLLPSCSVPKVAKLMARCRVYSPERSICPCAVLCRSP